MFEDVAPASNKHYQQQNDSKLSHWAYRAWQKINYPDHFNFRGELKESPRGCWY